MNLASLLSDLSTLNLAPAHAATALISARPSRFTTTTTTTTASSASTATTADQNISTTDQIPPTIRTANEEAEVAAEAEPDPALRRAKRLLALHARFTGSAGAVDAELRAAREAVRAVAVDVEVEVEGEGRAGGEEEGKEEDGMSEMGRERESAGRSVGVLGTRRTGEDAAEPEGDDRVKSGSRDPLDDDDNDYDNDTTEGGGGEEDEFEAWA